MSPEKLLHAVPTIKERNLIKPTFLSKEIRNNFEEAGFAIYDIFPPAVLPFSKMIEYEKKRGSTIAFPNISNPYTVAVETITIPQKGEEYEETKVDKILGFKQRLHVSPDDAMMKLHANKNNLLEALRLPKEIVPGLEVRFPSMFELYVLDGKEKWIREGGDERIECTNDLYPPFEGAYKRYVCLGYSTERGDKEHDYYYLTTTSSSYGYHNMGFRFLIAFPHI